MKNNRSVILFLFVMFALVDTNAQGLFKYFKWTAYSDGPEKMDHVVIDLNHDRFQALPIGITQSYFSLGVDAYMFHDHPMNKKGTLAWALGVGYSGMNVHHNGQFIYQVEGENVTTHLLPYPDGLNVKKNKISLNYVEIPFELRIRTMNHSIEERNVANFRFYLGFKGGVLVNSHTKYRDEESKVKVYDIDNLLLYRYGPTLRIGFKKLSFHAFYSMTSIFEEGKGPELYPFSVGLCWMRL
ncbi:MAG: PorT family protein [Flavobacteriales bacterium]|nr:PorT family protein [Flavobacteriales bacterium]MCB9197810.1 PorT family protein [Flavobacteriales bacterium]